jgi:large subunit ribosomal protein L35
MEKPIYRHLARTRWEKRGKPLLEQRLHQFHVVPDVLPKFSPRMDLRLFFGRYHVSPGVKVPSVMSARPPTLGVQAFDGGGERLVTVVVMDSDVPNLETDSFDRRLHFLAANIPISASSRVIRLHKLEAVGAQPAAVTEAAEEDLPEKPPMEDAEGAATATSSTPTASMATGSSPTGPQIAVPWLPPTSQKGAPYHRLTVWILEQSSPLDVPALSALYSQRDGFSLKSFRDKFSATPAGFTIFRSEWDAGTARVMEAAGIPGAELEFRNKKVRSTRPPRKARGWEARHQGPKFRHLWKYTHRIATPKRKFVR